MKILFILKERFYGSSDSSYGLINSSNGIKDFLVDKRYDVKVVTVIDYNGIDKEVYNYKPDIVIIEALWVTGTKIKELSELPRYKNIKWIIRVHSDMSFLCTETMALTYINDYIALNNPNVIVSLNNKEFIENLSITLNYIFLYLPNIISILDDSTYIKSTDNTVINIGCFGALRILKNQCFQALCSINAAEKLKKKLKFHITSDADYDPNNSNPILKNLVELFKNTKHELVIHKWMPNDQFSELIKTMDIGIQISYTESFNIVAANFVNNNKIIVVSEDIDWMPGYLKVSPTNYDEVINKIIFAYKYKDNRLVKIPMILNLASYNKTAKSIWTKFLKS
jgi:hypothetical protein